MRLLLALLSLLSANNVFGLQCYSTDIDAYFASDRSNSTIPEDLIDCSDLFDQRKLAKTDFVLKCFTLTLPGNPVNNFKGCFTSGCDIMTREFKRRAGLELLLCKECRQDGCNEDSPTEIGKAMENAVPTLMLAFLAAIVVLM